MTLSGGSVVNIKKWFLVLAILVGHGQVFAIVNLRPVDGAVFRGGRPSTSADYATLAQLHIKTIIDLQGGDIRGQNPAYNLYNRLSEPGETKKDILQEKKLALAADITEFFSEPLNSNDPVSSQEQGTLAEVLLILRARANQPVYIHCAHGVDRTGLVMALYAVKYRHMTPEGAYKEWLDYGHGAYFNQAFTGNLDVYFWKVARTIVPE